MYCEHCGNKLDGAHKFCTKCGNPTASEAVIKSSSATIQNLDQKWWMRLAKVVYVVLYLSLLIIIPLVWSENSSTYSGYYGGQYRYEDTYGTAFWYSLLTLVIYIVVVRLVKITFLYIAFAQKPQWKREFKKFF